MKYYKIITEDDELFFVENKCDISDEEVKEIAIDEGVADFYSMQTAIVEEISENEYEERVD